MFSINVHPHPSMLGKAYADFVHIVSYHYYHYFYTHYYHYYHYHHYHYCYHYITIFFFFNITDCKFSHVQVDWKSFVILYESEEGLVRLQELIKLPKTFSDIRVSKFFVKLNISMKKIKFHQNFALKNKLVNFLCKIVF